MSYPSCKSRFPLCLPHVCMVDSCFIYIFLGFFDNTATECLCRNMALWPANKSIFIMPHVLQLTHRQRDKRLKVEVLHFQPLIASLYTEVIIHSALVIQATWRCAESLFSDKHAAFEACCLFVIVACMFVFFPECSTVKRGQSTSIWIHYRTI